MQKRSFYFHGNSFGNVVAHRRHRRWAYFWQSELRQKILLHPQQLSDLLDRFQNFWLRVNHLYKQTFPYKSKIFVSSLTCSSIYPSRLPWPELQSCESIGCSKVCLILNIMELRWRSANGAKRAKQINAKNSTVMSLSRNHDQVARDNSHRCCEECHVETTFLLPTNQTKAQKEAYIYSSMRCLLIKIAPLVFTCHAVTSISLAPMSAVIWLAGCIHVINHVFTWENAL